MRDEERTGEDLGGTEPKGEHPFFEKLRTESDRKREVAEAFTRGTSQRPQVEDLLEAQRNQATQIAELGRSMGRMRRSVWFASLCSATVAVALLALGGYFYTRPIADLAGVSKGPSARPGAGGGTNGISELVLAPDSEFTIRTDVDRKYQLIIRQLFRTVRSIRFPAGQPAEQRNASTDVYIQYMADVSRVIEQSAEDQASPEITQAIVNLALLGQELRKTFPSDDPSVESQNKFDQIGAILRARDVRSSNLETEPAFPNR